jgi:hypothetical protein
MFTSNDTFADQLGNIPIGELLKPDGLLCIWMTNSKMAHQGAEGLLKHWGMAKLAQWHWLKVSFFLFIDLFIVSNFQTRFANPSQFANFGLSIKCHLKASCSPLGRMRQTNLQAFWTIFA